MQAQSKREITYRDLVSWNVMDLLEREGLGRCVSFKRLFEIDPVKDTAINLVLNKLQKSGVIKKSAFRQGVEVVNPLMLAVLKAKIESSELQRGNAIIHDTRGVWGD